MSVAKPYRSVLDYETEEDLVKALEDSSISSSSVTSKESDCDKQRSSPCPDWRLSVYNARTTLVPTVKQEAARLQAVKSLQVLDTPRESSFDSLTASIKKKLQVPFVFVSIVDLGRQWFKSVAADEPFSCNEWSRKDAFCAHTILQKDSASVFQVHDTIQDPRFCRNPFVTGESKIRFYAGAPLVSSEGHRLGALCVADHASRPNGLAVSETEYLTQKATEAVELLVQRSERLRSRSALSAGPTAEKVRVKRDSGSKNTPVRRTSVSPPRTRKRSDSQSVTSPEMTLKKSRSVPQMAQTAAQEATDESTDKPLPVPTIPWPILEARLPDPQKAGVHPDDFLRQLVHSMYGIKPKVRNALELQNYFATIREDQMDAYNVEIVSATRNHDVQQLRSIFTERGRAALDCYNRFGEGLLNLACRRGFKEIVEFLLVEPVSLDPRVCDDYGRTPLHDACWNPEPQLEICGLLMHVEPSLFLVADKRNFTPFQYARTGDWHIWRDFLFQKRHEFQALMRTATLEQFSE